MKYEVTFDVSLKVVVDAGTPIQAVREACLQVSPELQQLIVGALYIYIREQAVEQGE